MLVCTYVGVRWTSQATCCPDANHRAGSMSWSTDARWLYVCNAPLFVHHYSLSSHDQATPPHLTQESRPTCHLVVQALQDAASLGSQGPADLTTQVVGKQAGRQAGWVGAACAGVKRAEGRAAARTGAHGAAVRNLLCRSTAPARRDGTLPSAVTHRIKRQHLVHGSGAHYNLIVHWHATSYQARIASLQVEAGGARGV